MPRQDAPQGRSVGHVLHLAEQAGQAEARLAYLTSLARRMASGVDPPAFLQEIVAAACEFTGARHGALAVLDSDGRTQQLITHGITPEEQRRGATSPEGRGLPEMVRKAWRPLRPENTARHPPSVRLPPGHSPTQAFLGVPVRDAGESLGSLYVAEKREGLPFTREDEDLLVLLATQAALAIRSARLRPQAEPRARLAGAVLESSRDFISIIDTQTFGLTAASRSVLRVLNRPEEEVLGQPCYKLFFHRGEPCSADPEGVCPLLQVKATGEPAVVEKVYDAPDGRRLNLEVTASPVRETDGSIRHAVYVVRDITARKQVEDALQAERERLDALVNTSPIGIFVTDASGQMQLVNREAQRILGQAYEPGSHLGHYEQAVLYRRPDGRAYRPEDLPLQRAFYRGERVYAEEIVFEFPEGRTVTTLVNATPVYAPDGQIAGAIAIIQDISPLEEMERLRGEFLGMVSHELKTPLTAIKGAAATVLGSQYPTDPEDTRELFQIIDDQADRLRELVDNLLDMTRIEAGALSVRAEPLDLGDLLEEARAAFARSGASQEPRLPQEGKLPPVKADRRRIVQVLSNLLGNAAKFSPPDEPISIEVEPDAHEVTIHVRGRGRGIPPDRLPHIFKKFSRAHDDEGDRRLAGTGLGLAISRGIVEAHGGRIWADSAGVGKGTTLSFTLPLSTVPPVAHHPPRLHGPERIHRADPAAEKVRILAVDDEAQVLRYLKRSLGEADYSVIVTSDPAQLVPLLESQEPQLVLMDLVLPGASGFDLVQRVREFSDIPVICLTASNDSEHMVRALRLGADDYITKPFSPSELLARIEAVLRRRTQPGQAEARPPLAVRDLLLDFAERRVTVAGREVRLTATEYRVLYELATHAGLVLTHDQLLQRVWGAAYLGETELVRAFIRNLRRKLGDSARQPRYILTEPQAAPLHPHRAPGRLPHGQARAFTGPVRQPGPRLAPRSSPDRQPSSRPNVPGVAPPAPCPDVHGFFTATAPLFTPSAQRGCSMVPSPAEEVAAMGSGREQQPHIMPRERGTLGLLEWPSELERFVDRAMRGFGPWPWRHGARWPRLWRDERWLPELDVYRHKDRMVVRMDLPGV